MINKTVSNLCVRALAAWRDGLLSGVCFLCGELSGVGRLCPACERAMPERAVAQCPVCAAPAVNDELCGRCQSDPPAFDATQAWHLYVFPVDRMVHALKYRGDLSLAAFFAHQLATLIEPRAYDMMVPMPLHPRRLSERGFNQAHEIARWLARARGVPLSVRTVRRVVDTRPQADLPWRDRKAYIRSAFMCAERVDGARVLVVDDVMTTGASLDALARALKTAGAARVDNLVVARTPPPD